MVSRPKTKKPARVSGQVSDKQKSPDYVSGWVFFASLLNNVFTDLTQLLININNSIPDNTRKC